MRQAKPAKKAKVWKQLAVPDRVRLIIDKREELYGKGESEEDGAIVDAYTPEEFAAALALANALDWESDDWEPTHLDNDPYGRRVEQRRQQGRGHQASPMGP
jgi:hypothetical protein